MSTALRQRSQKSALPRVAGPLLLSDRTVEKVLRQLTATLQGGRVTFVLSSGRQIQCDSGVAGPEAILYLHSLNALRRLLTAGYIGLAEGYMAAEWSTPSLRQLFDFGTANETCLNQTLKGNWAVRLAHMATHRYRRNSRRGSRKNITRHYDLGNAFFSRWLDPSMTYSAALFRKDGAETLLEAQNSKYQRIITELGIETHHRVLEIGCGWGGFAEKCASETGAHVTAITVSPEQKKYAAERLETAGLTDRTDVQLRDYRDVDGQFDRIVSIEMLEAVGEAYWPTYFGVLANRLKSGGRAMVQVITVPDAGFDSYRNGVDFIQRHIFPGGMLLSPGKIEENALAAGLEIGDEFYFGGDYARTLDAWADTFQKQWPQIVAHGFDDRFKRTWEYYLGYSAAGFRAGKIDLGQFCFSKP